MKIAILGAGIAGLEAAYRLRGMDVAVFESNDRLGGCLHTAECGGGWYEAGGEWIDAQHALTLARLHEFGLIPEPADERPMRLFYGGEFREDDNVWPDAEADVEAVHEQAVHTAGKLPETLSEDSLYWPDDELTLDHFVNSFARSEVGRWLNRAALRSDEGGETTEVGLLGWLYAYRNYLQRGSHRDGMSAYRFPTGGQRLCQRLADESGADIRLGAAVDRITIRSQAVVINGEKFDHAINTIPPARWHNIRWDGAVPQDHLQAAKYVPRADIIKVAFVFKEPFWRSDSWNGALLTDGDLQQIWDGGRDGANVLLAYICGNEARAWAKRGPDEAAQREMLQRLEVTHPGATEHLLEMQVHSWVGHPHTSGAFSVSAPGYVRHARPVLPKAMNTFHFAGEYSDGWLGFVEGAMASAKRAVEEIQHA